MRVLGEVVVEVDGVRVQTPAGQRSWALLAWMLLHPGLHPRSHVATTFWPGVLDRSARASLRSALWSLRRGLGAEAERALTLDRQLIGARPGARIELDAARVEELEQQGQLAEAARAGHGVLLPGFDDEWVLDLREDHRSRQVERCERLARAAIMEQDLAAAVEWTQLQWVTHPHDDVVIRRLMARLAESGQVGLALKSYQRFETRLRVELDTDPAPETARLAALLRAGRRSSHASTRPTTPLIGRSAELDAVLEQWQRARHRGLRVVLIRGESGIGKTRLVDELVTRARSEGASVASCVCLDLGGAPALAPWAELAAALAASADAPPSDAAWWRGVSTLVPGLERGAPNPVVRLPEADPGAEGARLFESVVALVGWAARGPLLLTVDDLHAADAASLDLMAQMCRRLADRPVLVVLTRRPWPPLPAVDALEQALRGYGVMGAELEVSPLDRAEVATLVRRVSPALSPAGIEAVVDISDGNPLLASEWAGALARGASAPPAGLVGLVRTILAQLTPDAVTLARLIAVAGRDLGRHEVAGLPLTAPLAAAIELSDCDLFTARDGKIGYRHVLLREAACHDLSDPARTGMLEALAILEGRAARADSAEGADGQAPGTSTSPG